MPARRTTEIPFAVNRDDARTLLAQVTDGLRDAIVGGRYAPGDIVPSSRALASCLGVSHIVTEAALKRLAEDGFVVARPRVGCVVRDRSAKQWLGHVVFVYNSANIGYFQSAMAEALRSRLNKAGYLFTRTAATFDEATGTADFSLVDAALSRSVDLVLAMTTWRELPGHLARLGVPYAFVSYNPRPYGVGATNFDNERALLDFAETCKAEGIRRAVTMKCFHVRSVPTRLLRAAGIETTLKIFGPVGRNGTFSDIEQTGFDGFSRMIKSGRIDRDTIYYFEDDYLARGALMAMTLAGLRAPHDIRIAIQANRGFVPVYDRELTRIEIDPVEAGAAAAADALAFLRTGHYPDMSAAIYKFIRGETMGASSNAECRMQNFGVSRLQSAADSNQSLNRLTS
jgi:DNA-binding transcriptional regulator YhcF (GntR family)